MTRPLKIFSDFDGTITRIDGCDLIVDACIGRPARQAIDSQIVSGALTFRQGYTAQFAGVNLTWEEARARLHGHNNLDPTFPNFVRRLEAAGIPLVILSAGLRQVIREYLAPVGLDHLEIRANAITVTDRTWTITFWDDTPFGHDKAAALQAAQSQGFHTVFIGDGISDIPAAVAAGTLFAKTGHRLAAHCAANGIVYHPFANFDDVLSIINQQLET